MKKFEHSDLDYLPGPFSRRIDQFTDNDIQTLYQVVEWSQQYCESAEEFVTKEESEADQIIFDPMKFRTSDRAKALRLLCGYTLEKQAELLNVTRVTATKYERDGYKDGLTQKQLNDLIEAYADNLYNNNMTPMYAQQLRFMIPVIDPKAKAKEWSKEVLDELFGTISVPEGTFQNEPDAMIDGQPIEIKYNAFPKDKAVFQRDDVDLSRLDVDVLMDRARMIKKTSDDMASLLAENVDELDQIHTQILKKLLGDSLYELFKKKDADTSVINTVNQILSDKNLSSSAFFVSGFNRMSTMNTVVKFQLPGYPILAEEHVQSVSFDDQKIALPNFKISEMTDNE